MTLSSTSSDAGDDDEYIPSEDNSSELEVAEGYGDAAESSSGINVSIPGQVGTAAHEPERSTPPLTSLEGMSSLHSLVLVFATAACDIRLDGLVIFPVSSL